MSWQRMKFYVPWHLYFDIGIKIGSKWRGDIQDRQSHHQLLLYSLLALKTANSNCGHWTLDNGHDEWISIHRYILISWYDNMDSLDATLFRKPWQFLEWNVPRASSPAATERNSTTPIPLAVASLVLPKAVESERLTFLPPATACQSKFFDQQRGIYRWGVSMDSYFHPHHIGHFL